MFFFLFSHNICGGLGMGKYKVDISGINTGDLQTLKASEMESLFLKYQKGDLFARDLLIEGNLKLVLSILKRFYYKADNLDDLFQIGCVGLIKAIDHFDLGYEVKFSTYAVKCVLNEVYYFLRKEQKHLMMTDSLDKEVATDNNGNSLTIGDTVSESISSHEKSTEQKIILEEIRKC